jgi:hypothetical protein
LFLALYDWLEAKIKDESPVAESLTDLVSKFEESNPWDGMGSDDGSMDSGTVRRWLYEFWRQLRLERRGSLGAELYEPDRPALQLVLRAKVQRRLPTICRRREKINLHGILRE